MAITRPKRKVRRSTFTKVTVDLPSAVELTKLNSNNSVVFKIRSGETLLGTVVMGRGSVEWWPRGNSVNKLRKSWKDFAAMLDQFMR